MNMKKMTAGFVGMLCAAALLGGCGSSYEANSKMYESSGSTASQAAMGAASYEYDSAEAAEEGYYEAEAEAMEAGSTGNDASYKTNVSDEKTTEAAVSEEKLVYTSYMTIQTLTFKDSYDYVAGKISEYGGIIQSESTYDNNNRWYYNEVKSYGSLTTEMTVRIPSANYKAFISSMEGAGGKITSQSQTVENITKRYNDQTILIESLKTQEKRLLEMMEKAETVEDMIYIEQRLSEVQTQLNQAKNVLSGMDTDVAFSTVHLTLQEVVRYESRAVQTTFGDRLSNTVSDSWKNFLDFLEDFLSFLIYIFPLACLVLVIFLIVFGIRKLYMKANPEKAAAAAERKAARKAAKEAVREARRRRKMGQGPAAPFNRTDAGFTVNDQDRLPSDKEDRE